MQWGIEPRLPEKIFRSSLKNSKIQQKLFPLEHMFITAREAILITHLKLTSSNIQEYNVLDIRKLFKRWKNHEERDRHIHPNENLCLSIVLIKNVINEILNPS